MATIMLVVLLDHHHWALLLASGPAAHHDNIRTLLHHLEMLRESLAHREDYILLRLLLGVGWLLGMNLLHIHHLMLCCLDIDKLVVRAHLLLVDGIKGGSHLIPPGCLVDLVSWWGILLLSC